MNQAVTKLMHDHAPDFKKAIPKLRSQQILGHSMGIFHKNPAHPGGSGVEPARATISPASRSARAPSTWRSARSSTTRASASARCWNGAVLTVEQAAQDEVGAMVNAAAEGDFSKRVPLEGKSGFLREIAKSMNELGTMVDRASTDFADAISGVAQGDLTRW
jgi:methyl-accepting chemotaxis protein